MTAVASHLVSQLLPNLVTQQPEWFVYYVNQLMLLLCPKPPLASCLTHEKLSASNGRMALNLVSYNSHSHSFWFSNRPGRPEYCHFRLLASASAWNLHSLAICKTPLLTSCFGSLAVTSLTTSQTLSPPGSYLHRCLLPLLWMFTLQR